MSAEHSPDSNIKHHKDAKSNHTPMSLQIMEQKSNMWRKQTTQRPDKAGEKYVQEVMRVFLFYAWAVDNTMLVALSAIASEQAKATEKTLHKVNQFLDYAASNLDAILMYQASNMVLAVHSKAYILTNNVQEAEQEGIFTFRTTNQSP